MCRPIRTWIGPVGSASVIAFAAATRSRRRGKGEEERVALRVHLDSTLPSAGLADHAAVLGEGDCVRVGPELVQQLRRALNVGEEEGDGAGGKVAPHMRHHAPKRDTRHARRGVVGRHARKPPREGGLPHKASASGRVAGGAMTPKMLSRAALVRRACLSLPRLRARRLIQAKPITDKHASPPGRVRRRQDVPPKPAE